MYAMVLTSILLGLTACAGDSAGVTEAVSTEPEQTETEAVVGFVEKDFGGRAFNIVSRGSEYGAWESFDVYTAETNGDPLNDAVYERNAIILDKYGIEIVETKLGNLGHEIKKMVTAGEALYDAAVIAGSDASVLSSENFLLDLNSLPELDLTNEWWDQNAVHDFGFGDKLFYCVSDFLISDKDGSWVYLFNKRIANELDLEYPYQMVKDGTWTYDKMHSMAQAASADLNGDGKMTVKADRWGIITEAYDSYASFFYSGARIYDIGTDGYPEYVLYSDRNVESYNKYLDLFVRDASIYCAGGRDERQAYLDGRALFLGYTLIGVRDPQIRDLEDDFGIIPAPKYDENQENYGLIVSIGTSGSVLSVPLTAPDPAFSGYALDACSKESTDTLLDTYINKGFNGKYIRDEESAEMLKICFESRVYDISIIYTQWGGLFSKLYGQNPKTKLDLASLNASVEDAIQESLNALLDLYKNLE